MQREIIEPTSVDRSRLSIMQALDYCIERGQPWITSLSWRWVQGARELAQQMVAEGQLDSIDGYIFRLPDPPVDVFVSWLRDIFIARGFTQAQATDWSKWTMQRALSDGQGGWNYNWGIEPQRWDKAFAEELAARYLRLLDDDE